MNRKTTHLRAGIFWTSIDRFSVVFMQVVAMYFLARLLVPEDFAVIGIAIFFINISQVLIDSGMGGSLLRKKEVALIEYSTLFVYNMMVGAALYFIIILFAPFVKDFYKIPDLDKILIVIGASLMISAFGKIQNVMLLRDLKFKILSQISIASSIISLAISILLAYRGHGVWALVVQNLSYTTLVVLFQFCVNRYIPRILFSRIAFEEQWRYGSNLLYSKIISTSYNNILLLILPKFVSLDFSGFYTQANKIKQIPSNILNSVVKSVIFPVMAKISDENEVKLFVRSVSRRIYLIGFSIFLFVSVCAKEVILVTLGHQWSAASKVLTILCWVGTGLVISAVQMNTLKSRGLTKGIFHYEIYNSVIGLIVMLLMSPFGSYYILYGMVFGVYISNLIFLKKVSQALNTSFIDFLWDVLNSVTPALAATVTLILCKYMLTISNSFASLVIYFPVYVLFIGFYGMVFKNEEISYLIQTFRRKFLL